ncbi:MAG TPA: thioesterase family protein [Rhodanobacteraceae bacterium]
MPVADNLHLGHAGEAYPDAFYVRRSATRFISTLHAQGAWQPGEQHLAPASGLLLAEVERRLPSDKLVARASFDVLGVIHSGEFDIDVHMLRPGRSIELIEASMRHGDRTSIRARIWRLAGSDTTRVQGVEWPALPAPGAFPPLTFASVWGGGFIASLEARRSADARPGRGRGWLRTRCPLVAGEPDPPVAGFLKLVDTANGLVVRERPGSVFFANVDLTVHFIRQPEAGWVGFDTRVNFGPGGLGETLSILSDGRGPVGTAAQSLTVRLGGDWPGRVRGS